VDLPPGLPAGGPGGLVHRRRRLHHGLVPYPDAAGRRPASIRSDSVLPGRGRRRHRAVCGRDPQGFVRPRPSALAADRADRRGAGPGALPRPPAECDDHGPDRSSPQARLDRPGRVRGRRPGRHRPGPPAPAGRDRRPGRGHRGPADLRRLDQYRPGARGGVLGGDRDGLRRAAAGRAQLLGGQPPSRAAGRVARGVTGPAPGGRCRSGTRRSSCSRRPGVPRR
jgi:hypothetical protein